MAIEKYHVYKMWLRNGTYIGTLNNVKGKFGYALDINSPGPAPITITLAQSGDTVSESTSYITTEEGRPLTTESGSVLVTEQANPNFGPNIPRSKVQNGNIVEVTEYSDYYPNGLVVFTGKVVKYKVNFGGDEDMELTLAPRSMDLSNHLIRSDEVLMASQLTYSNSYALYGGGGRKIAYFYNFESLINLSSVSLFLSAQGSMPTNVTVRVFKIADGVISADTVAVMDNPNNALSQSTITISSTTPAEYKFLLDMPVQLQAGPGTQKPYTVTVEANNDSGNGANMYYQYNNVANGSLLTNRNDGAGWRFGVDGTSNDVGGDFYFKFYTIPPFTKATLTSFEPSDIIKKSLNNYASEGGIVTYSPTSIQPTGINVPTYTFSVNTMKEAMDTFISLSPTGFYYTIDPGTNIMTYRQMSTTADIVLTFKKHFQNFDLQASIENLKNSVYFTGGQTTGTNLFLKVDNQNAINKFDVSISRISDIKVTNSTVGSAIASLYLDKRDDEAYETKVTILDSQIDINIPRPGMTIAIKGTGSPFIDSLIIPIARVEKKFDKAVLDLGVLPVRAFDLIEDAQDSVQALETVANPNQPS